MLTLPEKGFLNRSLEKVKGMNNSAILLSADIGENFSDMPECNSTNAMIGAAVFAALGLGYKGFSMVKKEERLKDKFDDFLLKRGGFFDSLPDNEKHPIFEEYKASGGALPRILKTVAKKAKTAYDANGLSDERLKDQADFLKKYK